MKERKWGNRKRITDMTRMKMREQGGKRRINRIRIGRAVERMLKENIKEKNEYERMRKR